MNRDPFRGPGWVLGAVVASALVVGGCQDGLRPSHVAEPDTKPGELAPPPPQPPADPAIVFVGGSQRNGYELRVMNVDGSNLITIYGGGSLGLGPTPSWSPDGRSVVFETAQFDLWLIDVTLVNGVPTGTNPRVLLQRATGTYLSSPAWSPLGDQIAFARSTNVSPGTIEVVPAAGGVPTVVYTSGYGQPVDPAWSRDGARIAFAERDPAGGGYAIRAVNVATGAVTTLLTAQQSGGNAGIGYLDWGRTRDELTFQMYVGNGIGIYTFEIGGALTRVTAGRAPTWLPNDAAILFVDSGKLSKVELATGHITRLQIGGNEPDWRRF